MRCFILLASLCLIAAAPPPTAPSPAGTYEIHQMEMAGGLELQPDGHFRYGFTYGALDEEAEGDWSFDGSVVHLTSKPMPKEPTFELVSDTAAKKCTLSLSVDWGGFGWSSAPDVLVIYDGPRGPYFAHSDEQGSVHLTNCAVTTVMPIVPMFGVPGAPLNVSATTGHKLRLRFVPNDLGRVAFRDELLKRDGPNLVWERYDAEIRFLRVRP